jgi:hypothetical protein
MAKRSSRQNNEKPNREKCSMVNVALAIAFAISSLFSPGGRILRLVIDGPVLQSLPPYQGHLFLAFANYWIPAVLIYLVLRLMRAAIWLRPRPAIHVLLGLANVLLILYVAVRTFASTVQGGGASFVVMTFAPLVILPAWVMSAVGLGWLAIRTIRKRKELSQSSPRAFGFTEGIVLVAALGVPASVVASTLFLTDNAPFRLAREAKAVFYERCKTAGEKIIETPHNVQSVYLDRDSGEYFNNIVNGVFAGHGGGILGEPLVNSGWLMYVEKQNNRQRLDNSTAKYRKHVLRDWKGEPVEELTSDYGVFQKTLTSDDEKKRLQVRGTEVTVKNLKTGQVTATLTYFTSGRHSAICGQSSDGYFGVSDFVRKSLNLERRFPSAFPQDTGIKR